MPAELLHPRIADIARDAPRAGIFCDFDGSLAPIVDDPERARPLRGAARALHRLAKRYGAVAVISGRPVRFLAHHLHARGVRLVGLYGIEERAGRHSRVLPEVQQARSAVDRAAARLRSEMTAFEGVYVEHKGYAVSVHFRRARDPKGAALAAEPLIIAAAKENGLHSLPRGRQVVEIAPPAAVDKGHVVRRIMASNALNAAIVIGDDAGDLPMFEAVDGLERVARIAVRNDEAPSELFERADLTVADPDAVLEILKNLADARDR